jgi:hypothetical protein
MGQASVAAPVAAMPRISGREIKTSHWLGSNGPAPHICRHGSFERSYPGSPCEPRSRAGSQRQPDQQQPLGNIDVASDDVEIGIGGIGEQHMPSVGSARLRNPLGAEPWIEQRARRREEQIGLLSDDRSTRPATRCRSREKQRGSRRSGTSEEVSSEIGCVSKFDLRRQTDRRR